MTDHIPLPPPDYTEDVQGFVHDTQRHYYSEETMRAYAERLHAARVNGPAIMQAIGLLSTLQTLIGPHRPEDSKHKKQALWDQIEATRIALTPLAPAGAPTAQAAPQPAVQQGDANWQQLRSALAMAMLGWGGREDRTMETCYAVLDAVSEPGMPLALLRAAPDWRDAVLDAAPAAQGDAEDAASWRALAQPTEETIIEAVEASCAHRPSVDDDSYVLRILRVFTDAARSQAQQGGA